MGQQVKVTKRNSLSSGQEPMGNSLLTDPVPTPGGKKADGEALSQSDGGRGTAL